MTSITEAIPKPVDLPALSRSDAYLPSTELQDAVPDFDESVDLRDYIEVVLRRKWLILTFLVAIFVTTLFVSLKMTPIFKAEGRLEFNTRAANVTKFEDVVANQMQTREFVQTQVKLLGSTSLATRVIEALSLDQHPDFNPAIAADPDKLSIGAWLSGFGKAIKSLFSSDTDTDLSDEQKKLVLDQAILGKYQKSLEVQPERDTTIVSLAFSAADPALARDVVNTLLRQFIDWQMDKKLDSANSAKQQLEKQIEVARVDLEKSEVALNKFARKAGIVSLDSKMNLIYRQLEEINNALAVAESERISKEALFQQSRQEGPDSLPQVVQNELIRKLREEYIKLLGELEELRETFKDGYPRVKSLQAKLTESQNKIRVEEDRIVRSIERDYLAARERERSLRETAETKKALAMQLNDQATQYKILERETGTNKSIFDKLLERSKEIDANVGSEISNIQIVDFASLPLQPYKPKVSLNLLLAIVVGLMGGVGMAFLLEYLDNTVKRIDEISDRFRIPLLGVIPRASSEEQKKLDFLVRSEPKSSFSEAVRTAKVSIQLSSPTDRPLKTILMTSTAASEGKSTLANNLALSFASSEERVVLIDCDLRRPRLHKVYPQNGGSKGLSLYLSGIAKAEDLVQKTEHSGLYFIPAGITPPNPAELLASSKMKTLLQHLGKYFDRIILDGPPYAGFADVLVLGNQTDGVILVSTLNQTHREALRVFRKSIHNVHGNLLGSIVNKFEVSYHYGNYYYKYYKYYHYSYRPYGDQDQSQPKGEVAKADHGDQPVLDSAAEPVESRE